MRRPRKSRAPRPHHPVPCTRTRYAHAVLHIGGWQTRGAHVAALVAIMVGEGSQAAWNPMDTTLPRRGATPYNSFGPEASLHVWDYPTAAAGVSATVATLRGADMAPLARILHKRNATTLQICERFAEVPWAYIGDRLPEEIAAAWRSRGRSFKADARVRIQGPGLWPYG